MCKLLTMNGRRFALMVSLGFAWAQVAGAQQRPEGAAGTDANYILRTYEVGDLVLNIQDHPYSDSLKPAAVPVGGGFGGGGGGFGGGGGGVFSVPDVASGAAARAAARHVQLCQFGGGGRGGMGGEAAPAGPPEAITIGDLVRVLTSVVSADSWAVHGGEGQVEPLGTALVVWQTAAIHERIGALLDGLRAGSADRKTVTIDARWLLLHSDELEALLVPEQEGVPAVDRKVLAELTRRPGSLRGITNCFSGQLVYLVSGTRRNVVSGFIPVVGSIESPLDRGAQSLAADRTESLIRLVADTSASSRQRSVGYQPIVEKPNFGALLEVRPTLVLGNRAIVNLKSTLTVAAEQAGGSVGELEAVSLAPQVDRLAIETQEFATTLRVPLGKPVLAGGLTYVPASAGLMEVGGQESEKPQLYLVLEVR